MNRIFKHYKRLALFCILLLPAFAAAQQAKMISINTAGTAGGNSNSFESELQGVVSSADGRYVLFMSIATDLTADADTNSNLDVYVRDTLTNMTRLVSVSTAGNSAGNGGSEAGNISSDGRYVVFSSTSTDLVAQAAPGGEAVYMRDMQLNVTTAVSVTAAGAIGTGDFPIISGNGNYVVFRSFQPLAAPDSSNLGDVYLRNLQNGTTKLVSVSADGMAGGDMDSLHPIGTYSNKIISDDGRYIAFQGRSTNISSVPNSPIRSQIYVRDMQNNTTEHVSVNPAETALGNGHSGAPLISGDGRYVSYQSEASNLLPGDPNNVSDVFQRDLQTNITTLLSVNNGGTGGTFSSGGARISADGRYTAFASGNSLLPNDPTPGTADVYVFDRQTGTNRLVSANISGVGAGGVGGLTISDDGRYVAFSSSAQSIVTFDNQITSAIFVRDVQTGRSSLLSRQNLQARRNGGSAQFATISADGQTVAFTADPNAGIVPQPSGGIGQLYQTRVAFLPGIDFSGDGRAELAVFRPSAGVWYTLNQTGGAFNATGWGQSGDRIVPGDYDGDGKLDHAVFRAGVWFVLQSSNGSFYAIQFGVASDVPVPADYDGDGATDIAVFRDGVWHILDSGTNQYRNFQWGSAGDTPVSGDYDRDGRADLAVFRGGIWYILQSDGNVFRSVQFGIGTDKPVHADYDGDLRTDIAVFRDGIWYFLLSTTGQFRALQWGISTDLPVPSNYFGLPTDAANKLGVYRDGFWYVRSLQDNSVQTYVFGLGGDLPIPNAYY